ncbi:hypothetical protein Pan241w_32360 [Gimesia alba]|uniref:Uncharacterized protein n=1 Tax=Gimesia alba TaxID=2527973 RepID=A0A517RGX5_9PLAN|nr:hypothetical protein Pan241w_32360 [Gimesia alba]
MIFKCTLVLSLPHDFVYERHRLKDSHVDIKNA